MKSFAFLTKGARSWTFFVVVELLTANALFGRLPTDQRPKESNVLLLIAGNGSRPAVSRIIQALQEEMLAKRVRVQAANVDLFAERDTHLKELQTQWFKARYAVSQFDLIIAFGDAPLLAATALRNEIWPKTPMTFFVVDEAFQVSHAAPLSTGITATPDWAGNLRLARQLFPNVQHIALTGGSTASDHQMNDPFIKMVHQQDPLIGFIDLTNLLLPMQLERAKRLPPNTVIMYGLNFGDASGNTSIPLRGGFREMVTRELDSPVLFAYDSNFYSGGLGGYMAVTDELGKEAADLGLSILAGKTSQDALVEFAPPTLWESHAEAVVVTIVAFAAQSLLIAFLILERRRRQRSQRLLAERLRFETILTQISSRFAHAANGGVESAINDCLYVIQEFFGSRTASVWESVEGGETFLRSYMWPEAERSVRANRLSSDDYADTLRKVMRNENVIFSNEAERDKLGDRESFRRADIRSFIAIPLQDEDRILGCLSLANFRSDISITAEILSRLRIIADIVGNTLARRHASKALRESEALRLSLLESIPGSVAVIDQCGIVLAVNQHWIDLGANGVTVPLQPELRVGSNYLNICQSTRNGDKVIAGIRSVLSRADSMFEIEYDNHPATAQQWFRMTVIPLPRSQGGAVVTHLDITQQKLAELEEQRLEEQLILLNRSSEMGQLAASLAHELAQPIAAALSNAQAALRLATRPEPDLAEMEAALIDIIEDEQRAGAVLKSIRSILKKQSAAPHPVNLNEIVDGVAAIIKNNAESRNVQIRAALSAEDIVVMGDEIPLQQVVINLVNNAMDSMNHLPPESKILTLRTGVFLQQSSGFIEVDDEGTGVAESVKVHLFSPFFTTKSDGLGMGLAICRTILQSLGGSITCTNRSEQGATFSISLPLAREGGARQITAE